MPNFKKPQYEFVEKTAEEAIIAVDTEADRLDPHRATLLLVQVGTAEKAYVIDAQKVDLSPLKNLFGAQKPLKLLQNAKFDYKLLKVQAGLELANIFERELLPVVGRVA